MAGAVRLRIFAKDPGRARAFYAQVFGWSLPGRHRCCWMVTSGDDPRLGVNDADEIHGHHPDEDGVMATSHVVNLDATAAAALAAGGEILVPRIPLPGTGWLVYLADIEGNVIGLMQDDPAAAWPQTATGQRSQEAGRVIGTT